MYKSEYDVKQAQRQTRPVKIVPKNDSYASQHIMRNCYAIINQYTRYRVAGIQLDLFFFLLLLDSSTGNDNDPGPHHDRSRAPVQIATSAFTGKELSRTRS